MDRRSSEVRRRHCRRSRQCSSCSGWEPSAGSSHAQTSEGSTHSSTPRSTYCSPPLLSLLLTAASNETPLLLPIHAALRVMPWGPPILRSCDCVCSMSSRTTPLQQYSFLALSSPIPSLSLSLSLCHRRAFCSFHLFSILTLASAFCVCSLSFLRSSPSLFVCRLAYSNSLSF
jgi:hypothetical protein